ncbi:hypothetical protein CMQ_3233 [Grosmannia clavigera kw1407]|uniref:Uncharacterized protein n=1 Tax=Grosmannia clavigera (strain kw1407 / UAMH 11150) TaxID=655863 RepID=F0XG96_GROCL|nr:uncharacterized protein CMQ_3233 [Grosmannia clavigera kw1407]EFX03304.1 hypothetical protein CMQ_3233 [Grosmannia clavigera kw1407]
MHDSRAWYLSDVPFERDADHSLARAGSHPLLEQVPLTVSPFVNLPRAATLPYRYKAMPSALPPSILGGGMDGGSGSMSASDPAKPPYVVSAASGTAAHPDDILASCRVLREHVARMQADADAELRQLEERIQARDLAERRRLAPGWLDSDEHLLVPERRSDGEGAETITTAEATTNAAEHTAMSTPTHTPSDAAGASSGPSEMAAALPSAAEELHRTLGGLAL